MKMVLYGGFDERRARRVVQAWLVYSCQFIFLLHIYGRYYVKKMNGLRGELTLLGEHIVGDRRRSCRRVGWWM